MKTYAFSFLIVIIIILFSVGYIGCGNDNSSDGENQNESDENRPVRVRNAEPGELVIIDSGDDGTLTELVFSWEPGMSGDYYLSISMTVNNQMISFAFYFTITIEEVFDDGTGAFRLVYTDIRAISNTANENREVEIQELFTDEWITGDIDKSGNITNLMFSPQFEDLEYSSPDVWREELNNTFPKLPDSPVGKGAVWSVGVRRESPSQLGNLLTEGIITYTVADIINENGSTRAYIDYVSELEITTVSEDTQSSSTIEGNINILMDNPLNLNSDVNSTTNFSIAGSEYEATVNSVMTAISAENDEAEESLEENLIQEND